MDTTATVRNHTVDSKIAFSDILRNIVGASLNADITEKLIFNVRGDIGGFGVGSDFSWNALGLFGYRFTKNITGLIGYRALYVDYKAGTGSIRYNATIHGPITGLCFSF